MITQITKETERGYEWLVDSDFQDVEALEGYLTYIGATFERSGFNVFADVNDVRHAEAEMLSELNV
jgi:hypothetical protein